MSEAAGRVGVLGGTSGIGLASAQQLVRAGHQVTIAGRDPGRLRGALATLMDQADGRTVDATDRVALDSFFEGTGGLGHLVVAVTGARGGGPFRELDLAEVLEGIEAKTLPQLHAVQAALPHLSPNGSITLITAVSARMANPATAGLAVINAGLEAAVRTLAVELAPLRLNAVSPGVIDTPWWQAAPAKRRAGVFTSFAERAPAGRSGTANDVALAVQFLVEASFVTGVTLPVDGGFHLRG